MEPEPIAPTPAAEPAGFAISSLFGGEPTDTPPPASPEPLPAAGDPSPDPAAPVPASAASLLEQMLGNPAEPAKEPPPAAPAASAAFDLNAWLKEQYPEAPDGVVKLDNWKASRDINVKLIQSLADKEAELAAAKAERASVKADGGAALPETEAVKKLSLEMAALQQKYDAELGEYQKSKASGELEANHAFRQEHDGQRAALFDAAKEVADEAGISEDTLKSIFDADTEYKMARALSEVEDDTAAALLKEKANAFRGLTKAKETALKNPTGELQKWRDYEAGMPGVLAGKITEGLRQRFAAESLRVGKELADPEKGEMFFRTPAGQAKLAEIQNRFDQGFDMTPAEHVRHMALAEAMPIYRDVATKQAKLIGELQSRLSRYERADPAQTGGQPAGSNGAGKGFSVASLFGQPA